MPGDVKFQARVAPLVLAHLLPSFDSQILTSMPHKRQFFGPFLGFDWGSFASKTSSFSAFQNAKSCVCTRSVGSFRKNNIFLPFPCLFPPCRVPFAYPCRRHLPALSCDNSNRLPRVGGHVKRKGRGTKRQVASVRGRVTGAGRRGITSASLTDFVSLQARRPTGFCATSKLKLTPVWRSCPPCCHSERSEESRSGLFCRETARKAADLTRQRSALPLLPRSLRIGMRHARSLWYALLKWMERTSSILAIT